MINWLRRADPAFYHKEPHMLRMQAQIARYTDEAQAEVRLGILRADRTLQVVISVAAFAAYAVATGVGALEPREYWPTIWALAVLAVAGPRALPWWPEAQGWEVLRDALIGAALVLLPALWSRADPIVLGIALLVAVTLSLGRGRARIALLVLAIAVLFGSRVPARALFIAPLVAVIAGMAMLFGGRAIAREWRPRPQTATWLALAALLLTFAYAFAFNAQAVAERVPVGIAFAAIAYMCICIMWVRVRRAQLSAQPDGVLSIPQSIVPLLDRSHDHAVICWLP